MTLRDTLNELRIPFKEQGESSLVTEGWIGIQCPFCGVGTGKTGMGIHVRSKRTNCWKCGPNRLGTVLAAASDRPIREILALLEKIDYQPESADDNKGPAGRYTEPEGVGPLQTAHRNYLTKRGYDPDAVSEVWGIRGIGLESAKLKWRLFFPVSRHGELCSWTTRAIGNSQPRYLAAPPSMESRPLKSMLFGMDQVRHGVVVTEGPFDAMRIGPGAVCTFGLSYTRAQVLTLSKIPVRVVCFDNEPGAQRRANALADLLAPFPGQTHVAVTSGPDPDSSPTEEIQELRSRFLD